DDREQQGDEGIAAERGQDGSHGVLTVAVGWPVLRVCASAALSAALGVPLAVQSQPLMQCAAPVTTPPRRGGRRILHPTSTSTGDPGRTGTRPGGCRSRRLLPT